jgi:hypothetical protein
VFDEEYHIFGRKSSSSVTNGRNVRGEGCVKIPSAIPRDGWYGDVYTAHYSHHGCIGTEDFSASSDCINGCRGVYKVQKGGEEVYLCYEEIFLNNERLVLKVHNNLMTSSSVCTGTAHSTSLTCQLIEVGKRFA